MLFGRVKNFSGRPIREPNTWFAWRPVRLINGMWAWLEDVERIDYFDPMIPPFVPITIFGAWCFRSINKSIK
jgi:hypothetical protein